MSPCPNVLLTIMWILVLFKNVRSKLMKSICIGDWKWIRKVCKIIQNIPPNLNFSIETTPFHSVKFWSSCSHRSPCCFSLLLFMLKGLTKLKCLWARERCSKVGNRCLLREITVPSLNSVLLQKVRGVLFLLLNEKRSDLNRAECPIISCLLPHRQTLTFYRSFHINAAINTSSNLAWVYPARKYIKSDV